MSHAISLDESAVQALKMIVSFKKKGGKS